MMDDEEPGVAATALQIAFVQGAAWWEYQRSGATIWPSARGTAEMVAAERAAAGTLGRLPEPMQREMDEDKEGEE